MSEMTAPDQPSTPASQEPHTLQGLLERLRSATGPDRELDARLTVMFDVRPEWCVGYGSELWIDLKSGLDEPVIRINTGGKRSQGHPPMGPYAPYTASLDAALALVERTLPDPGEHLMVLGRDAVHFNLTKHPHVLVGFGYAPTAPLAVLIALLTALSGDPLVTTIPTKSTV